MTGVARVAVAVLLLGGSTALLAIHAAAQAPYGPLGSTRLTGGPIVTLDLPPTDATAFSTATRVLAAARVPHGAEGPAPDPARPRIDFAQTADRSQTLTGLTVGAALDAVARAHPALQWSERDGLIVVRMPNRGSFLDRRIRRLALENATPRDALDAILREIAPDRINPDGIAGLRSTTPDLDARLPAREGRNVTAVLSETTLLEALNSIARQNGALSWTVTYQQAPATVANATISLRESGRMAVAAPPDLPELSATAAPSTRRIHVLRDMPAMLETYAKAAKVAIGVEHLPQTGVPPMPPGMMSLDLDGWPPEKAIALIVAHDSRYEWRERSGRFLVMPKSTAAAAPLLSTRFNNFIRSREPFDSVVASLIAMLGAQDSRVRPMTMTPTSLPAGTLEAARQKPVTVTLRGRTTARDALEALCRAAGGLSWTLRGPMPMNDLAQYSLEISSPEGWEYSRSFAIAAPARPHPGASLLPAELDRDIERVSLTPPAGVPSPFFSLAVAAKIPIGLELRPEDSGGGDPRMTRRVGAAFVGPGRFSTALAALLERAPGYALAIERGVVNVGPAGALEQHDHFLNRPIGPFEVNAMPASRVVALVNQRMRNLDAAALPPGSITERIAAIEQPVTIELANPTPRHVLNELVKQAGNLAWVVSYAPASPGDRPAASLSDVVLSLAALWPASYQAVQFGADGVPRLARPEAPPAIPATPSGRRATLTIPVDLGFLEIQLAAICRLLDVRCSIEQISSSLRRSAAPPRENTGTYDFTGLSPADAFPKLTEFVPDLEWRFDGNVYRWRTRAVAAAGDLPLDRRIPQVDRQLNTLPDIFALLRDLLDPAAPGPIGASSALSFPGAGSPKRDRPVSLSLRDVTVRQVLDEIARQHGDLQWSVRYVAANGLYPELMLTFFGDGWGSGQGVRVR